ncbi:tetratricopeptide repeat protein [Polyangium spumosum]|uniref:Tetratricopeptide repeat protein n=1 Tax=Polyangium spumosum TaxID=889282 RepID=A0A6N7PKL2_9BACT|nr:tetratricopeptide repeat protein [Polyangium spumosum]
MTDDAAAIPPRTWEPEALLGEDMGRAYRRFVEWMYDARFCLAVVEVSTPWKRDALIAWTSAKYAGVRTLRLDEVGPRKKSLWRTLEETCAPEAGTKVLILERLEEAEERQYLMGELNIKRDELVRDFPVMWIVLVHRAAAMEMRMKAPDFCDIARTWLWEEHPPELKEMLSAIEARSIAVGPAPMGEGAPGRELLDAAAHAIELGYPDEAADLLAQFDMKNAHAREVPERVLLEAKLLLAQGRYAEAQARAESARAASAARNDQRNLARALYALAGVELHQGHYSSAEALFQECLVAFEHPSDSYGRANCLNALGLISSLRGQHAEARTYLQEATALYTESGDGVSRAASLQVLAGVEAAQERYVEARALLLEAIAILSELGDRSGMAATLYALAKVEILQEQYEEARGLLERSLALNERTGFRQGVAASLGQLANVHALQGRLIEAQAAIREAITIQQEIGDAAGRASSQLLLGQLEVGVGRYEDGRRLVQQAVETLTALGSGQAEAARAILRKIDALAIPPT